MSSELALLHGSTAVVGIETESWAAKAAVHAATVAEEKAKRKAIYLLSLQRLIENGDLCRNCEDRIEAL